MGLASSVARELDYDALFTLHLAREEGVGVVQLYLSGALLRNGLLQEMVADGAALEGIRLILHSPAPLERTFLYGAILPAIRRVLSFEERKKVVFHFHRGLRPERRLDFYRRAADEGIVPCIEDYYARPRSSAVREDIEDYGRLLLRLTRAGVPFQPVWDIPRLFNRSLLPEEGREGIVEFLLSFFAALQRPLILHAIDASSTDQRRSRWCPLGRGTIPFREIFRLLVSMGVRVEALILEFEEVSHVRESLRWLRSLPDPLNFVFR